MQRTHSLLASGLLTLAFACSGENEPGATVTAGAGGGSGGDSGLAGSSGSGGSPTQGGTGGFFDFGDAGACPKTTCAQLGWACGYTVDMCGNVVDCADEGLTCADDEVCV